MTGRAKRRSSPQIMTGPARLHGEVAPFVYWQLNVPARPIACAQSRRPRVRSSARLHRARTRRR
ncbi:protein of unassigned function [Methylobacterium oryzae CBMB20]|uniref:Protein of unassigned function n=1 Tax=Methylobacterium oryzae CBMB20 TaxID=693986 RepID=A0A089NWK3_9HYPH|nr:protein of unassigned function [Methylobacterium oryzae CBMB20]